MPGGGSPRRRFEEETWDRDMGDMGDMGYGGEGGVLVVVRRGGAGGNRGNWKAGAEE